jgi:hypothetical protein
MEEKVKRLAIILVLALVLISARFVDGCTIVMVAKGKFVLVGNNEDWKNPKTKMWFIPSKNSEYGRVCFGFDDMFAQGGMNDQGLFIDANAIAPTGWKAEEGKLPFTGEVMDRILATCATVKDAIAFFEKYNVSSLRRARFPIADKSGESMVVEWAEGKVQFVKKVGVYQVSTNFVMTNVKDGNYPCWRYKTAKKMLEEADEISIDLVRNILSAAHLEGRTPTQYSNIFDLKSGDVYIYYFHDFTQFKKINLKTELGKGRKTYDLPSLFSE